MGDLDWMLLAQSWNTLRAFVKRAMNFWGSIKRSEFLDAEEIFVSQEGLCSAELTDIFIPFKIVINWSLYVPLAPFVAVASHTVLLAINYRKVFSSVCVISMIGNVFVR